MNCDSCDFERQDAYEWDDPLSGHRYETATYQCVECGSKKWKANKVQAGIQFYG